ncbi:MAG TPA: hypothetical protein PLI27_05610 [Ignavibacteriales bacterium]|nr:hypothetical protein [Ignavibacteriales bacterium]HOL81301.1 hypothetical protein [Ignavibacteriales bacterium]HOM66043.1 hypothetical protein [Ignavibacteriales bacterium]HPD67535.1 hypothetical protein [Ignavibacteriales bacterium]HPP33411.1 hypothetical protein [Ignavibacteriales bacterium]
MIENIKRINFDVSFNNSYYHPAGTFYFPIKKPSKKFRFDVNDNVIISPAAEYLNKYKLLLSNLIIDENKRILFEFKFNDIEFYTQIFFELFFFTSRKNYIIKANSVLNPLSQYEISLAVKKTAIKKNFDVKTPDFSFFKNLILDIDELNIYDSISRLDSPAIQTIIDNYEKVFYNEMQKLTQIMYNLIQYLGLLELKENYTFPSDNYPNILLDKITRLKE